MKHSSTFSAALWRAAVVAGPSDLIFNVTGTESLPQPGENA